MTTPSFDITTIVPKKWKPWVGLIGALLTFIVPTLTQVTADLPQPWPVVIAAVIAGLTWLGIYKAPYVPTDAVMVPKAEVTPAQPQSTWDHPTSGGYQSPWPRA